MQILLDIYVCIRNTREPFVNFCVVEKYMYAMKNNFRESHSYTNPSFVKSSMVFGQSQNEQIHTNVSQEADWHFKFVVQLHERSSEWQ